MERNTTNANCSHEAQEPAFAQVGEGCSYNYGIIIMQFALRHNCEHGLAHCAHVHYWLVQDLLPAPTYLSWLEYEAITIHYHSALPHALYN